MAEKFQNKYRIPSARWQDWDYGSDAAYYVTICTKDRECLFGEIVNGIMHLSHVGIIADVLWYEIKNHAKNVELGEFVVMPNHIHGIVVLDGNDHLPIGKGHDVGTGHDVGLAPDVETGQAPSLNDVATGNDDGIGNAVETGHALSLPQLPPPTPGQQRFQNPGKNTLSSIVGNYKSAVTKHAHRLKFNFAWQSRFHDHVIRDDKSFQNISAYIVNNPLNWSDDKFHR